MTGDRAGHSPQRYARAAGVLYLVIIVLGLSAELLVRSALVVPGDAAATARHVLASPGLFRAGFVADSVMFLADVALAVLLYVLLKPVSPVLALVSMCFRLAQSAVLASNLLHYHAAMLLLAAPGPAGAFSAEQLGSLAAFFLDLHAHGYDLGLLLFGMHCLVLGYLVFRSGYLPRALGVLLAGAGFAYLVGSYTRFLFPDHVGTVAPVYLVAIVAELSMCLWLLLRGVDPAAWTRAARGRASH